MAAVIEFG